MHDIKEIRKNFDFYNKKISERGKTNINLNELISLDKKNRELIQKKEQLESKKKKISKSQDENNYALSKNISTEIISIETQREKIVIQISNIINNLPNLALEDVPVGKDEKNNKVIRTEGNIKKFDFKVKSHIEIGDKTKDIDFETSIKLSGSRFVVLKKNFALLERALINLMLDTHTNKFGYIEVSPPIIVNENVMFGTGQLPKFLDDQFEVKSDLKEKKFLIPTAEVVLTNLVRKKVLSKNELPLRYVASTPCFRKEAGSYGKDTKGMIRQHQFYKVELVSIVEPAKCMEELNRMLRCAEEILKILNLPYRIVLLSSGDMGFSAQKTFDIEVWIPSENKYREISSCSSCGTFQARRMDAKYKDNDQKNLVGTLNGSGLAVGRLIIALLENNQNKDGSVNIPDVLKKYMNNINKI
tara:strand:- start:2339 stop:3586 length:1248 start_codon:yes stop_codon:yes gene_type:complete